MLHYASFRDVDPSMNSMSPFVDMLIYVLPLRLFVVIHLWTCNRVRLLCTRDFQVLQGFPLYILFGLHSFFCLSLFFVLFYA